MLAIKKNSFESVLMRWMKLEPIIQSEVSQKDKDRYNILRQTLNPGSLTSERECLTNSPGYTLSLTIFFDDITEEETNPKEVLSQK